MLLYGTEGSFARREGAWAGHGDVGVFTAAEMEAGPGRMPVRLPLPVQVRYCRAGMEGEVLTGAVKRTAGSFSFAYWKDVLWQACWMASPGGK